MSGAAHHADLPVNSILPVVSAQGVASEVAFQPGSVIAGRVLSVSPDNQVRIAIGHSTIDVQSQVPLQAGQVLQFAVSKTDNGNVQLAIVTPQNTGAGQAGGTSSGDVTLAPDLPINLANAIATSKIQLTSLEAQAVSTATQSAVTQQASLATLFANLGAATSLKGLPQQLQQAVAQVLAQRPPLDAQLTGEEVKSAFQNSGLFLESSLAKGSLPQGGLPDMKAALIVLRSGVGDDARHRESDPEHDASDRRMQRHRSSQHRLRQTRSPVPRRRSRHSRRRPLQRQWSCCPRPASRTIRCSRLDFSPQTSPCSMSWLKPHRPWQKLPKRLHAWRPMAQRSTCFGKRCRRLRRAWVAQHRWCSTTA